ncbi:MAG: DUF5658 family protein [Planctomycetota bacterium]
MRRRSIGWMTWLVACVGAAAQEPPAALVSEPIAQGFAVVAGRYLPPPYTLAWEEGELRLNGQAIVPDGPASRPWRRPHWRGALRWRGRRTIARYEEALRQENLLVAPRGKVIRVFGRRRAAEMLDLLVGDASAAAKVEALTEAGVGTLTAQEWAEVVERFEPTADLPARLAALHERLAEEGMDSGTPTAPQLATSRMLGGASTLLAALALGVLLTHRPDGTGGWRGVEESGPGTRLVLLCAGLLVVLNGFDLAVTLVARGSESFLEVNPLVASFLDNAGAVVAFKLGLVLPCVGVLLALRRRRVAQLAAWWTCLVYALVAVRWAVYTSVFLT